MQNFEAFSNYGWLSVLTMKTAEIKLKGTHQYYNPSETLAAGALVRSTTQQIALCIFLLNALTRWFSIQLNCSAVKTRSALRRVRPQYISFVF